MWIVVAILIVLAIFVLPEWMVSADRYRLLDAKDWAAQVSANRMFLVNLIGGIAVALTIYFTYRNFQVSQDKSFTDLFSKAVEQLGNADMSVRLGGIYSLARLAKSSKSDYFPVMQILAGFLRTRYQASAAVPSGPGTGAGSSRCPVEVQAILSIIGERYWADADEYGIDLSYIGVLDAWVPRAKFSDLFFWSARLTNWNFTGADLTDADFKDATLDGCDFSGAKLKGANFENASIVNSKNLTKAQLGEAEKVDPAILAALP